MPGIGVKSATLIVTSRRYAPLGSDQLKKMGVVMKKARYFITCRELPNRTINEIHPDRLRRLLTTGEEGRQLSLPFSADDTP